MVDVVEEVLEDAPAPDVEVEESDVELPEPDFGESDVADSPDPLVEDEPAVAAPDVRLSVR